MDQQAPKCDQLSLKHRAESGKIIKTVTDLAQNIFQELQICWKPARSSWKDPCMFVLLFYLFAAAALREVSMF